MSTKKSSRQSETEKNYIDTANADSIQAAKAKSNLIIPATAADSWINAMTGTGMAGYDKKEHSRFFGDFRLYEPELRDILTYNGLGKRIVNLKAGDMLRNWFTIEGDSDNAVPNYFRKIKGKDNGNAKREIYRALKWARGYGGALVVMGIQDGKDFTEPLDENNIKKIEFLHTFHRFRVSRVQYYTDPKDPRYWETEIYMVNPVRGAGYQVHESRCLIFDGEEVPPEVRLMNYGWGDSVLQAVYNSLRGLGESYNGCEHIIEEFILTFLTMPGLTNLIASGQEDKVRTYMNILDITKHYSNTIALDKDQTFNRASASVAGLPELMGKLVQRVSSESGYPVRKLFGEINVGSSLGTGNDEETEDYYADVIAEQEEKILSPLERISKLVMLSKEGPTGGKEIAAENGSSWKIVFPPLRVESLKETIENRGKQAEIDERYVTMGALDPFDEIRQSRFGGKSYSYDTVVDTDLDEIEPVEPAAPEGKDKDGGSDKGGPGAKDFSMGIQNVKTGVNK